MYETLSEADILILIYPNKQNPKMVLVLDPFDKKIMYYNVDSIEEVKGILKNNLPFCTQGHPPEIHIGSAIFMEWESLPSNGIEVHRPEDIDTLLS